MLARSPKPDSSPSPAMETPSPYLRMLPAAVEVEEDPLRLRLEFHGESVVLHDYGQGVVRTRLVSALDVAHALARELDLATGLLPPDTLWWAKTASGVRVAVWREPQVWTVRLREHYDAEPRKLRLPMPGLVFDVGYAGSGPADLALSMLRDTRDERIVVTTMAEQPAAIDALVDWLVSHGFALAREEYSSAHFGDWTRMFEAATVRVSIVRERGRWDISAAPAESHRAYSISAWSVCLGLGYDGDPWSFEHQIRFLRAHLGTMVRAAERNHAIKRCLDQAERSVLERELGWPADLRLDDVGRLEPGRHAAAHQREAAMRLARERRQRKRKQARRDQRYQ